MPAIIIPRKHLTQPQGRIELHPSWGADYAYVPWMGKSAIVGHSAGFLSQNSMSDPVVSRGGVGTTYAQQSSPSGPSITGYPFAIAAVIEVTATSGNVFAEGVIGVGNADYSSPAAVGVTSSFTGDARPSFRIGQTIISAAASVHGRVIHVVAVAESATSRRLYVDGLLAAESSESATMFQAGGANLAVHAMREYGYGAWIISNANIRLLGGAWFQRSVARAEAEALSANLWQLFRADPIRIYSFPSGPISLTINSITASNITQTGARITLGLTR